jgi:hypothetical protein
MHGPFESAEIGNQLIDKADTNTLTADINIKKFMHGPFGSVQSDNLLIDRQGRY